VTGTNIQRTVFRKRDFFDTLHQEYQADPKKRDQKAKEKFDSASSESSEELPTQEATKRVNSMNNMLPSVKQAHDEARVVEQQKKLDEEAQSLKR